MRIGFVIPGLGPGGAERVATLLANEWTRRGHEVVFATFEEFGGEPFFPVDKQVEIHRLGAALSRGLAQQISHNTKRVARLRSWLKQHRPDAAVAFMTEANVLALWAGLGTRIPVVVSERNQPERPGLGALHRLARRVSYPFAAAFVAQTEQIAGWARSRFKIPVTVIPNPIRHEAGSKSEQPSDGRILLSIGRLNKQKGYDVLLKSFAAVSGKHPDWRLVIYGEGPERAHLEELRRKSPCPERITLPGATKCAGGALARAGLFVLPSRFEGYPNALLEALGSGLPVIATDSPGASAEILAHGEYGLLVPPEDHSALTVALDRMMCSALLRASFAAKARDAVAHLHVAEISVRWLELVERVLASRSIK